MYWSVCNPCRSLEPAFRYVWTQTEQSSLADDYEENQYDVSQMKTADSFNVHTSCYGMPHIICGCSEALINIHPKKAKSMKKRKLLGFASKKASFTLQHSNNSKLFSGKAEAEKSPHLILVVSPNEVKNIHEGKIMLNLLYILTIEPDTKLG